MLSVAIRAIHATLDDAEYLIDGLFFMSGRNRQQIGAAGRVFAISDKVSESDPGWSDLDRPGTVRQLLGCSTSMRR